MKRGFDALAAGMLLALLAPCFAVIAIGIRLSSPGPVIFRQVRSGLHGRAFTLYKFRTMGVADVYSIETSRSDPRIFGFGRLLREYHIDELPQLWNVVRGDMSLVGPRPTVPEQVERYTERQRHRLDVRPGLTGLAQVSGGNALDWDDRIEIDLAYVARAGFWFDLALLGRTVRTILRREGLYGPGGRVQDKR